MRAFNDNADISGGGPFRPSARALLLPTVVIACGYGCLIAVLAAQGRIDGPLAKLAILVVALAVPFLLAHAILRLVTTRLAILPHALHLHPGFPKSRPYEVPYALIARTHIRRGIGGRFTGSGTLVLELAGGERIAAADLADPQAAQAAILQQQGRLTVAMPRQVEAEPRMAAGGRSL